MQIKTIITAAGVNEIDFGNDDSQATAHFYWFKNLSDSILYVSAKPNPVAGADNVAELPAKGAASVETDEGKVYALGAGKVEIHRTNSKFCPFELPSAGSDEGGGSSITVDSELSETSTNPLQNKATTAAINEVKTNLSTKADKAHTHTKGDITDFPDSLPANGGNADTVDGLHADDFVKANAGQIQLPRNADVPNWIYTNGKRYQQYMTNIDNTGMTNIPGNSNDYVWYWYDGLNIIARDYLSGIYYICDVINGRFSGWKEIYTSSFKPYMTSEISGWTVTDAIQKIDIALPFTPSAVICVFNNGVSTFADPIDNGFKLTINSKSGTSAKVIAFR